MNKVAAPERAARSLLGSRPRVSAGPPRGNIICSSVRTVKRPSALLACVCSLHAVTGLSLSYLEKKGVSRYENSKYCRKHHQPASKEVCKQRPF